MSEIDSSKDKKSVHRVEIDDPNYTWLQKQAEKSGTSVPILLNAWILKRTIDLAEKYPDDWIDRIDMERAELEKQRIDHQAEVNQRRDDFKWKMTFKRMFFEGYLKTLPDEDKRQLLERQLIGIENENWVENLLNQTLISLDNKKKLVTMKEGQLDWSSIGMRPDQIEECAMGYHTKGSHFCKGCKIWRDCEIRKKAEEEEAFLKSREGKEWFQLQKKKKETAEIKH